MRSTHLLHLTLLLSTAAALLPLTPQRLPTRLGSLRTDAEAVLDLRRVDTSRSELVSPGESTISRLWDLETWARHQKVGRYWRHLRKWPRSTTARLVLPVCVAFSLWSCVAHALRTRYFPNFAAPLAPLTLISSAVALLLTLRMNLSLLRLQESRLACVPLGLESLGLALPAVALATLGTSYVMVGIDQIGLELEQPFQLLPMNSLAAALTRDVCDELCVH